MNNKNWSKILLFIILSIVSLMYLSLFINVNYKKNIDVKLGYSDLSAENFEEKILILNGEWEFYPNEIKSEEFNGSYYIKVPDKWNNHMYENKTIPSSGIGTYRLRVKVPQKGIYCLSLGCIFSAYNLIINNEQIVANGIVNNSYESEVSSWKSRIVPFYAESENVEIILQVSNYHNNRGGILNNILLGNFTNINNNSLANSIKSAIIIGTFAGVGIYLIFLYKLENKKYTYLYLGLFCISSLVLESILDDSIIYDVFRNISFNVISKLEYLGYMGALIALQMFIKSIYTKQTSNFNFRTINIINMSYVCLIILTPNKIFSYSNMIYIVIFLLNCLVLISTVIKASVNKYKFAKLFLTGMFVMLLTTVIDILYTNNYGDIYFTPGNFIIGHLFFLLCQIYALSQEVEDAFESSTKAKDMEIAFLQAQIAPHFIFNTLNNIYCLMDESIEKARMLTLDFCDFLRVKHKFDYRNDVFYSLKEELSLVESYIKIENNRFNNLINLNINIRKEYMLISIPPLLIQPIVENSIKHGLNSNFMNISISALKNGDKLKITISDDGKGMGKRIICKILDSKNLTAGVGLKNVNFRLEKCYGSKIEIFSEVSRGTKVEFEIPMEVKS